MKSAANLSCLSNLSGLMLLTMKGRDTIDDSTGPEITGYPPCSLFCAKKKCCKKYKKEGKKKCKNCPKKK